tara:strand:+ start:72 stop:242 length:171 start_codon:yes stop_codon:yes gene_type:complete
MTKKNIINFINEIDENLSPMFNNTENLDTSDYLEVRYIDLLHIHDLVYKLKKIVGE